LVFEVQKTAVVFYSRTHLLQITKTENTRRAMFANEIVT